MGASFPRDLALFGMEGLLQSVPTGCTFAPCASPGHRVLSSLSSAVGETKERRLEMGVSGRSSRAFARRKREPQHQHRAALLHRPGPSGLGACETQGAWTGGTVTWTWHLLRDTVADCPLAACLPYVSGILVPSCMRLGELELPSQSRGLCRAQQGCECVTAGPRRATKPTF